MHALCLMTNQLHLIVTPPQVYSLADFTKSFAQSYAQYRNGRPKGSGKLFEERYWSEPIRTVFHLAAATMYIDRNPVSAGLLDDPTGHRWSTYRLHAGTGAPERWIGALCEPSSWWMSLGGSDASRARAYASTFELYAATALAREQARFYEKLEGPRDRYTMRLERPNRSRAREKTGESARYGRKAK